MNTKIVFGQHYELNERGRVPWSQLETTFGKRYTEFRAVIKYYGGTYDDGVVPDAVKGAMMDMNFTGR